MGEDARGLFGDAIPAGAEAAKTAGKRTKLYGYDSVAAQMFDPYGDSMVSSASLQDLWNATSGGGNKVEFFSHLAADVEKNPWAVGVGLSTTCQVLICAIKHIKADEMKHIMKDDLRTKAIQEADSILPVLETLNFGKGSQADSSKGVTMSALKRKKSDEGGVHVKPLPSEEEVKSAVFKLHEWLSREHTVLRAVISILAGEGTFYGAHVAEKVARAAIHCKPADKEHFLKGAMERCKSAKGPKETYDMKKDLGSIAEPKKAAR